jgi:uncharacterized damage-inducible protein DinB
LTSTPTGEAIASQFGAALDMLENAIRACPDPLWADPSRNPQYWYLAYHTLFYTDLYLSPGQEGFHPPSPYTLSEYDPSGALPPRVYTKEELLSYLGHGRRKLRDVIDGLTDESAAGQLAFGSITGPRLEVLLYSLRHVQHHAAQLNLILRQVTDSAPRWVVRSK